jgi:hypothetical protein
MIIAPDFLYCGAGVAGTCPRVSLLDVTVQAMTYPLTAAQAHLAELVAERGEATAR